PIWRYTIGLTVLRRRIGSAHIFAPALLLSFLRRGWSRGHGHHSGAVEHSCCSCSRCLLFFSFHSNNV
ncbi:hypothetical protein PFISCL1PPCAC_16939, partial [Pristionchus fissidentatus]